MQRSILVDTNYPGNDRGDSAVSSYIGRVVIE